MTDREKVVRAVETCFDSWIDKHRYKGLDLHEVERMKRNALELLKEQEPVPPVIMQEMDDVCSCIDNIYYCGNCGYKLGRLRVNYCENCGRAVKWE